MDLPSLILALINHALHFTVAGNWSITTAEPPPTYTRHPVYSPTATTLTAVTSLPIHWGPRLQCFFKSYFWPMQGSWVGVGVGGVATHPLQLLFISAATGHQHSFQSSPYSASTCHHKPQVLTEIIPLHVHHRNCGNFVCFPNNCNNDLDKGWKVMEYKKKKNWEIIEDTWLKRASGLK